MKNKKNKEDLELAEEHVELAEQIVLEKAKKCNSKKREEKIKDVAFSLERAEADLEEVEDD